MEKQAMKSLRKQNTVMEKWRDYVKKFTILKKEMESSRQKLCNWLKKKTNHMINS